MLVNVSTGQEVTRIPHMKEYNVWISRLTMTQIEDIRTEILRRIQGDKVVTAAWIPGADWTGTPFEAIYTTACCRNSMVFPFGTHNRRR